MYLVMGMSAEEFWHGDPKLAEVYRKSYEMKKRLKNENMWLQGAYVYNAIVSASPAFCLKPQNPQPYLSRPFPLDEKEENEQKIDRAKEQRELMKARLLAQVEAINNNKQRKEA